jgi:hypothetical protein
MTNVAMYMNIYKKYGKNSVELAHFKHYSAIYRNQEKTLVRIYKIIMKNP